MIEAGWCRLFATGANRAGGAGWMAAGKSNNEIAQRLGVTTRTVEIHMGNLWDKLGLRSRGQAAAWGREHRLWE